MSSALLGLPCVCEPADGGSTSLMYSPAEYVSSYLPWYQLYPGTVVNPVSFLSGKDWISACVDPRTIKFEEVADESGASTKYTTVITAFLPFDSSDVLAELVRMRPHRFLVSLKDRNGVARISGTKERPLEFSYRQAKERDTDGYFLRWQGVSPYPSWRYEE